eukprot:TRINITY_DN781_c0_g1_i2.p1 TRINITY_DN781_c0_g1~~TRINITY_DN781_c0_g1_i2.p1  ORF type:complete len:2381 (-),score=519.94 TRINITY_DN781_c0_g1_i2:234-7376(-)
MYGQTSGTTNFQPGPLGQVQGQPGMMNSTTNFQPGPPGQQVQGQPGMMHMNSSRQFQPNMMQGRPYPTPPPPPPPPFQGQGQPQQQFQGQPQQQFQGQTQQQYPTYGRPPSAMPPNANQGMMPVPPPPNSLPQGLPPGIRPSPPPLQPFQTTGPRLVPFGHPPSTSSTGPSPASGAMPTPPQFTLLPQTCQENFVAPPPLAPPPSPPPPPSSPPPPPPPPPSAPPESSVEAVSDSPVVSAPLASQQVPPQKPSDETLARNIEILAQFVAKNGQQFEDMARAREALNPKFSFLFGGEPGSEAAIGAEYFRWMKSKCMSELKSQHEQGMLKSDLPHATEEPALGLASKASARNDIEGFQGLSVEDVSPIRPEPKELNSVDDIESKPSQASSRENEKSSMILMIEDLSPVHSSLQQLQEAYEGPVDDLSPNLNESPALSPPAAGTSSTAGEVVRHDVSAAKSLQSKSPDIREISRASTLMVSSDYHSPDQNEVHKSAALPSSDSLTTERPSSKNGPTVHDGLIKESDRCDRSPLTPLEQCSQDLQPDNQPHAEHLNGENAVADDIPVTSFSHENHLQPVNPSQQQLTPVDSAVEIPPGSESSDRKLTLAKAIVKDLEMLDTAVDIEGHRQRHTQQPQAQVTCAEEIQISNIIDGIGEHSQQLNQLLQDQTIVGKKEHSQPHNDLLQDQNSLSEKILTSIATDDEEGQRSFPTRNDEDMLASSLIGAQDGLMEEHGPSPKAKEVEQELSEGNQEDEEVFEHKKENREICDKTIDMEELSSSWHSRQAVSDEFSKENMNSRVQDIDAFAVEACNSVAQGPFSKGDIQLEDSDFSVKADADINCIKSDSDVRVTHPLANIERLENKAMSDAANDKAEPSRETPEVESEGNMKELDENSKIFRKEDPEMQPTEVDVSPNEEPKLEQRDSDMLTEEELNMRQSDKGKNEKSSPIDHESDALLSKDDLNDQISPTEVRGTVNSMSPVERSEENISTRSYPEQEMSQRRPPEDLKQGAELEEPTGKPSLLGNSKELDQLGVLESGTRPESDLREPPPPGEERYADEAGTTSWLSPPTDFRQADKVEQTSKASLLTDSNQSDELGQRGLMSHPEDIKQPTPPGVDRQANELGPTGWMLPSGEVKQPPPILVQAPPPADFNQANWMPQPQDFRQAPLPASADFRLGATTWMPPPNFNQVCPPPPKNFTQSNETGAATVWRPPAEFGQLPPPGDIAKASDSRGQPTKMPSPADFSTQAAPPLANVRQPNESRGQTSWMPPAAGFMPVPSHMDDRQAPSADMGQASEFGSRKRRAVPIECKYYKRRNGCYKGSMCRFAHHGVSAYGVNNEFVPVGQVEPVLRTQSINGMSNLAPVKEEGKPFTTSFDGHNQQVNYSFAIQNEKEKQPTMFPEKSSVAMDVNPQPDFSGVNITWNSEKTVQHRISGANDQLQQQSNEHYKLQYSMPQDVQEVAENVSGIQHHSLTSISQSVSVPSSVEVRSFEFSNSLPVVNDHFRLMPTEDVPPQPAQGQPPAEQMVPAENHRSVPEKCLSVSIPEESSMPQSLPREDVYSKPESAQPLPPMALPNDSYQSRSLPMGDFRSVPVGEQTACYNSKPFPIEDFHLKRVAGQALSETSLFSDNFPSRSQPAKEFHPPPVPTENSRSQPLAESLPTFSKQPLFEDGQSQYPKLPYGEYSRPLIPPTSLPGDDRLKPMLPNASYVSALVPDGSQVSSDPFTDNHCRPAASEASTQRCTPRDGSLPSTVDGSSSSRPMSLGLPSTSITAERFPDMQHRPIAVEGSHSKSFPGDGPLPFSVDGFLSSRPMSLGLPSSSVMLERLSAWPSAMERPQGLQARHLLNERHQPESFGRDKLDSFQGNVLSRQDIFRDAKLGEPFRHDLQGHRVLDNMTKLPNRELYKDDISNPLARLQQGHLDGPSSSSLLRDSARLQSILREHPLHSRPNDLLLRESLLSRPFARDASLHPSLERGDLISFRQQDPLRHSLLSTNTVLSGSASLLQNGIQGSSSLLSQLNLRNHLDSSHLEHGRGYPLSSLSSPYLLNQSLESQSALNSSSLSRDAELNARLNAYRTSDILNRASIQLEGQSDPFRLPHIPGHLGPLSPPSLKYQSLNPVAFAGDWLSKLSTTHPQQTGLSLPGYPPRQAVGEMQRDQYDPLLDSIEPAVAGVNATSSKALPSTKEMDDMNVVAESNMVPFTERSNPYAAQMYKNDNLALPMDVEENNRNRKNGATSALKEVGCDNGVDAVIDGVVEDESPGLEERKHWSPGHVDGGAGVVEEDEIDQVRDTKGKKNKDDRTIKLLRLALTEFVKDVLKPSWREGHMSKEAFKTIVKKAVDKATAAMQNRQLPRSRAKIDQYVASSERKLTKLVQGYVDKYIRV